MSRIKLRMRDISLLERLRYASLEIGDLPVDSIARLTELGLVTKVLGCCEITRKGQLAYYRQHFLKTPRRRVAHVTRRNPMYLSEVRADKPGFIGALGTLFGENGVNVATFNLGRDEPGGNAIALIETDAPISDEVLAQVRALPNVVQAARLSF